MNVQQVRSLPSDLLGVIAQTRLFTDARRYFVLSLDVLPPQEFELLWVVPFSALVRDKDEITLVISEEVWMQYRGAVVIKDVSPVYRLITFDAPLDFGVVGYLAAFATALGEVGVSLLAMSSFSRDHIFVQNDDFERAWEVLSDFIGVCRVQAAKPYVDVWSSV